MAEINIQKKRKPALPWILLIILIIIIAWVAISYYNSPGGGTVLDENAADTISTNYGMMNDSVTNQKVNQYIGFIDDTSLITDEREYLIGAIDRLYIALLSISDLQSNKSSLDSLTLLNERIHRDSSRQNQSRLVKRFFISAAHFMDSISEKTGDNSEMKVKALRESALKIDEQKSINSQMDKVQNNFELSGDAMMALVKNDRKNKSIYDNY